MNDNLRRVIEEIKNSLSAKHNFVDAMPEHNNIVDSPVTEITPVVTEQLQPIVTEIAPTITEQVQPIITDITPVIEEVQTIVTPVIEEVQTIVAPIVEDITPTVIEEVQPVVDPIITDITTVNNEVPLTVDMPFSQDMTLPAMESNIVVENKPVIEENIVAPVQVVEALPVAEVVNTAIPEEQKALPILPEAIVVPKTVDISTLFPTLVATNAPVLETMPNITTIAEHVPYIEKVDLMPTVDICVVDSNKALIGRISNRGLAKLESHFAKEASLEMQDETPTKPIITEHPDNVVHGLKEISESKVLSFEAMKIGGLIKPTDITNYIINTANHNESNLAQRINNQDINKVSNAFASEDHKVLEFPKKDDLQAKIDSYKARLKVAQQETKVQETNNVVTLPTVDTKPQVIDVVPVYEEQKVL